MDPFTFSLNLLRPADDLLLLNIFDIFRTDLPGHFIRMIGSHESLKPGSDVDQYGIKLKNQTHFKEDGDLSVLPVYVVMRLKFS